jgi:hypothetical protein
LSAYPINHGGPSDDLEAAYPDAANAAFGLRFYVVGRWGNSAAAVSEKTVAAVK